MIAPITKIPTETISVKAVFGVFLDNGLELDYSVY